MPAGVHHGIFLAILPDLRGGRSIGEAGLLRHRQPVHVGAQQHQRPIAVAHHPHDAGSADILGHFGPCLAQFGGHARGGLCFEKREFRVLVEVDKQIAQIAVVIAFDRLCDGVTVGPGRRGERTGSQRERGGGGAKQVHWILPFESS